MIQKTVFISQAIGWQWIFSILFFDKSSLVMTSLVITSASINGTNCQVHHSPSAKWFSQRIPLNAIIEEKSLVNHRKGSIVSK